MDNASFHKSIKTKQIIESAGCRLLFQPPYSPDLNPIEQQWAIIKRKFKHKFETFYEAIKFDFSA